MKLHLLRLRDVTRLEKAADLLSGHARFAGGSQTARQLVGLGLDGGGALMATAV